MATLPADKIAQWKHDGFLSPFPLLDEEELQACRQGVERYEAWLGSPINAHADMRWRSMAYLLMPWAAQLARDPRILDKVEDSARPGHPDFHEHLLHQGAALADHRRVASGLDLLWTGAQGRGHGLDRLDRGERSRRLHGRAVLSREAAPTEPCFARRQGQRQSRRPGHHRAARGQLAGGDAAQAGLVLDASWAVPAPLRAQHLVAPPHRPGAELHPDPRQAVGFGPARGAARPWHRSLRAFRTGRLAEGRAGRKRSGHARARHEPLSGCAISRKRRSTRSARLIWRRPEARHRHCLGRKRHHENWEVDHSRTLVPVLHRIGSRAGLSEPSGDDGGAVRRRRAGRHHRPPGRRSDAAQPGPAGHRREFGGAGGTIGTARVAKAKPDGYTILLGHVGQATSVSLYK